MFDTIVVGTDGSETAAEAVRQAALLARTCGDRTRIHLVTAYQPLETASPRSEARVVAEDAAAKVRAEGVECETYGCAGDAAHALIEVAEAHDADLIVVGNKGMHSKARFLLGSVPNKVSHHAPCAVMIARTTA